MNDSPSVGGVLIAIVFVVLGLSAVVAFCAWAFSFHGVDAGHVAIVKEGGIFDGRNLKEVRQPGAGPKPIGAFNHQYSLPTTSRDLTEEVGTISVPTADGVNVNIDGQALFQLVVDGNPDVNKNLNVEFFRKFGLRPWGGDDLWTDAGWDNFLKIRLVPILYSSIRQTIGEYDCTSLNNTCVYVLNANVLADTGGNDKASEKAKAVDTSQNLSEAELKITTAFKDNLKSALGEEFFEGVQFQNLRVTFDPEIQAKITDAQAKRAEVASAKLEAQRKVQQAEGDTLVAKQQALQIKLQGKAYKNSPQQADIDRIKALCGTNADGSSKGCANLQVLGNGSVISNLK